MKRLQSFLVVLSVFGMSVSAASAASFIGVGVLDANDPNSWAQAVSGDGNVVVGYSDPVGAAWEHAFRWVRGSGMSDLGGLGGSDRHSRGEDVSLDGNVVVGWSENSSWDYEAFRWVDGSMVGLGSLLPNPNDANSWAFGVSADGNIVVGGSMIVSDPVRENWFRWEDPNDPNDPWMVGIGDGNTEGLAMLDVAARAVSDDGSIVVGHDDVNYGPSAYRWVQESSDPVSGTIYDLGKLPGRDHAAAHDVSADGNVVVGWSGAFWTWTTAEAFRWTAESNTMVGLGEHPDDSNQNVAWGVSPDGNTIVGESAFEDTNDHAFIWDVGSEKVFDLKKVLVEEYGLGDEDDLNNWVLTAARDINSNGNVIAICGEGKDPNDAQQGWVAVITPLRTPVANDDWYAVKKNTIGWSVSEADGVLKNDTDPDEHSLTATLLTPVTNGELTLDQNGGFEYTPGNWHGVARFTYRAYDAPLCSKPAEANIFVYPVMGDVNLDQYVNDDDLSLLLASWGDDVCWDEGELSGDDVVNDDDLSLLLSNWGGRDPNTGEPNEIAPTYQSTQEIDGTDYKVHDLFFTTDTDWTISKIDLQLTSGSLYQDLYGTNVEPNPALFPYFPDLEWDTYLTGPGGYAYPPGVIVGSIDDANLVAWWFDSTYYGPGTYKLARITLSTDADGTMTVKCSQETDDPNIPFSVEYEFDIEDGNIVPAQ